MNGLSLKVLRTGHRVRATDLASVLGVSRQRVCQIEALDSVTDPWRERYLNGLAKLAHPTKVVPGGQAVAGSPDSVTELASSGRRYAYCVARLGSRLCGRIIGSTTYGWGHRNSRGLPHHYPVPGQPCKENGEPLEAGDEGSA